MSPPAQHTTEDMVLRRLQRIEADDEQAAANPPGEIKPPEPFLKWAGGKRWFVSNALDRIPMDYSRYIEPFLGGGALFFALRPKAAILSDVNHELIDTYKAIRDDWQEVSCVLEQLQVEHCSRFYYEVRDWLSSELPIRAARLIYLNRTCWNGLYRLNKKGRFNVPKGTKSAVIGNPDELKSVSDSLARVDLRSCDFEQSIDLAEKGDLVFVDPPYTVKHAMNGFIKYNQNLFSWEDQIRLRDCLLRAKLRGVKIVSTNACHESIRELYARNFGITILSRASVISGSTAGRGPVKEYLITN